jgi:hypothetical protein
LRVAINLFFLIFAFLSTSPVFLLLGLYVRPPKLVYPSASLSVCQSTSPSTSNFTNITQSAYRYLCLYVSFSMSEELCVLLQFLHVSVYPFEGLPLCLLILLSLCLPVRLTLSLYLISACSSSSGLYEHISLFVCLSVYTSMCLPIYLTELKPICSSPCFIPSIPAYSPGLVSNLMSAYLCSPIRPHVSLSVHVPALSVSVSPTVPVYMLASLCIWHYHCVHIPAAVFPSAFTCLSAYSST